MLPNRLKRAGLAFLAGLAAVCTLIQHRRINQLRQDNSSLRGQIDALAGGNEALSNRLAQATIPQPTVDDPSHELLRLRGNVGVLRRQLQEAQSLAWLQTNPTAPSASDATRKDTAPNTRTQLQTECEIVNAILDKLRRPETEEQERLTLLSTEDYRLRAMLKQLESAEQRLAALKKERGPKDLDLEEAREEVADLNTKIQRRMEGNLLGLEVKLGALKQSLQAEEGPTKTAPDSADRE